MKLVTGDYVLIDSHATYESQLYPTPMPIDEAEALAKLLNAAEEE